jgi:2',3'-cyclic-nucleotide 2'-phosphodiesterase (5'-nucleotidase family)
MTRLATPFKCMSLAMVLMAMLPLASASAAGSENVGKDDLVIVSTADVRGSFLPCGCTIPKGGLPRRAALIDSARALHHRLLVVDGGAVFPDRVERQAVGPFIMQCMAAMKTDAVGVGDCDLTFGLDFLRGTARDAGLPLTCANLIKNATRQPAFEPWRLVRVADVKVGVFAVLAPDATRGPAADSLTISDPEAAARESIGQLKRHGATVIVLLSQLGNEATEALLDKVDGIDVVVGTGKMYRSMAEARGTAFVAAGGGERGYHVGVTDVLLDRHKHRLGVSSEAVLLGPGVRSQPEMLARAQAFEMTLPK